MSLSADERAVVFLDSLSKLEYVHKFGLLKFLGSPSEIFADNRLIARYFKSVGKENYADAVIRAVGDKDFVNSCVASATAKADGVITLFSSEYPEEFKNISEPPLAIYYKGDISLLKSKKKFSIVGSRKILAEYAAATESIAERLAKAGVVIVTGIAVGGDKAAILGGLKGGKVISVFAGGVDAAYPKSQEDLANKIFSSGLVISERPCGAPALNYTYIMRNRLIAALGDGTLVVGGDAGSGTRYTADFALGYGKDVCCLPYGFGEAGRVCKNLIKNGAAMVESAEDIAELMRYDLEANRAVTLSEEEEKILGIIKSGITAADEILSASPYPLPKTIETLAELEIKMLIVKNFDSYGII